jgi:hypothetical protein
MHQGDISGVSDQGRIMSPRFRTACWIITALMTGQAPGVDAQTRPEVDSITLRASFGEVPVEAGPGFKSGTTALIWSLFGTLVPVGAGVLMSSGESSDNPTPGFLMLGGCFGPALGTSMRAVLAVPCGHRDPHRHLGGIAWRVRGRMGQRQQRW